MPDWLEPIAAHQPLTPVVDTLRALLTGGDAGSDPACAVGWCLAILAIAIAGGAWLFRLKAGRR